MIRDQLKIACFIDLVGVFNIAELGSNDAYNGLCSRRRCHCLDLEGAGEGLGIEVRHERAVLFLLQPLNLDCQIHLDRLTIVGAGKKVLGDEDGVVVRHDKEVVDNCLIEQIMCVKLIGTTTACSIYQ
jgi:hypothetical protein